MSSSPRRRAAVVSHDASRTGAPISLLNICRAQVQSGDWNIASLCVRPGPLTPEFRTLGDASVIGWAPDFEGRLRRRLPTRLGVHREAAAARRWLRRVGPRDLVYLNTITVGHVATVARTAGYPVVMHVHELESVISDFVPAEVVRAGLEQTDLLFAASNAVRDNLIERHRVAPEKVVTVHEAIVTPRRAAATEVAGLRARFGLAPDAVLVLGVGTIDHRKGADLFVDAALASAGDERLGFAWVGRDTVGMRAALQDKVRLAGAGGRIQFFDEVDDLGTFYSAADLFALTSREDPYPLVMIEAAAAGIPVIAFEGSGGAAEFLAAGGGVLVPMSDVAAMSQALRALAESGSDRQRLAEAAAKLGAGHDATTCARVINECLDRMLAERASKD